MCSGNNNKIAYEFRINRLKGILIVFKALFIYIQVRISHTAIVYICTHSASV